MSRILFWVGDLFERRMPDDWECDCIWYDLSQWFYRLGWRFL